jgi:6-phosphogluconolactonase
MFVYVGTYTEPPGGRASGIEVFRFDAGTGSLSHVQTAMGVANPSFLVLGERALYAGERYLYAVNEGQEGKVTAFARDAETGELQLLNSQSSQGVDPCYVSLAPGGRHVLVANYTSGSIAALPIAEEGSLGAASSAVQHEGSSVVTGRQEGPHAHMIAPTPDGRAVLVTDLGSDEVVIYRFDEGPGALVREGAFVLDAGSGPRHFAFSPDGERLYVLNELASTLSVYDYDGEQLAFPHRQTLSTLPRYFEDRNDCAHVVVAPDGRFVYASNRGHDSIAVFAVDPTTGELTLEGTTPTGGKEPRNFALDPSGNWLLAANQHSDTIMVFRRDGESGQLTQVGQPVPVQTPVCIVFAGE